MQRGLDAAAILTPYAKRIADAGFVAVGRYLKSLTRAEVDALHAAGLDVWLIYEYRGPRALDGAIAGGVDGRQARMQAISLEAPFGTRIYVTVDFDPQPEQMPAVLSYVAAFAGAISPYAIGAYASGEVLRRSGVAPWLAGAMGWTGSRAFDVDPPLWEMKQGQTITASRIARWAGLDWPAMPFDYDPDVIAGEIAAWMPPPVVQPIPTPAPAPAPAPDLRESPAGPSGNIVIPPALYMQAALKTIGLYHGALDGDKPGGWGPLSQAALAEYYRRQG